jgi:hypothetical protein
MMWSEPHWGDRQAGKTPEHGTHGYRYNRLKGIVRVALVLSKSFREWRRFLITTQGTFKTECQ